MSEVRERFEQARLSEAELNVRQREVLDLLVAGKTNGEIGDSLGMSLDGAKWNVSEILGKLGLTSREEAAAYWQWRSRPAGRLRALRGLVGLGALKWAGGAALVLVIVAVVVALSQREPEEPAGLPPFYLEAHIEVTDRSTAVGTSVGNSLAAKQRASAIRWWQEDIDHVRLEVDNNDGFDTTSKVILADGKQEWLTSPEAGTYSVRPQESAAEGSRVRGTGIGLLIGPATTGNAGDFLASLKDWGGEDAELQRIGTETILGRETVIYEFSPAAKSGSTQGSNGEPVVTGNGKGRIWLDEKRMVVMRYVSTTDAADVVAQVTRLDWDVTLQKSEFRFEPPPGAVEVDGNSGDSSNETGSSGQRGFRVAYQVPSGFLDVGESPGGFLPYSWSMTTGAAGTISEFELRLAKDDGPAEITVMERVAPNGMPASLAHGDDVTVGAVPAKRVESGDQVRFAFERAGLVITVLGSGVTDTELLAVAESLEQVP
ncbi:MAG: LuxR C-terminal-related transcriptional regulator [bacterium]